MLKQNSHKLSGSYDHSGENIKREIREGRLENALKIINSGLEIFPQDSYYLDLKKEVAKAYMKEGEKKLSNIGLNEFFKGDYSQPLRLLSKAIELDNGLDEAYYLRSKAYMAASMPIEAANDILEAIELKPKMQDYLSQAWAIGSTLMQKAQNAYKKEEFAKCINFAETANLLVEPDYSGYELLSNAYLKQAQISILQKNIDAAQVQIAQAMEAKQLEFYLPRGKREDLEFDSQAFFILGEIWLAKGDAKNAHFAYLRSINANSENADAHFGIANAYMAMGNAPEAAEEYGKAIALGKKGPKEYFLHANALQDALKLEEALKEYEKLKIYRVDGKFSPYFENELEQKYLLLAQEFAKRADAGMQNGQYLQAASDFEQSIAIEKRGTWLFLGAAKAYFGFAEEQFQKGEYEKAAKFFQKAAVHYENFRTGANSQSAESEKFEGALIYGRLCQSLVFLQEPERADEAYKKAIECVPELKERLAPLLSECYYNAGLKLMRQSNAEFRVDEKIVRHFESAAKLDTEYEEIKYHLAFAAYLLYEKNGQKEYFEIANAALDKIINNSKYSQEAYEIRGKLRLIFGDLRGAQEDFGMLRNKETASHFLGKVAKEWVIMARDFAMKNKWDESAERYLNAIAINPDAVGRDMKIVAKKLYENALEEINDKEFETAKRKLGLALDLMPNEYDAMLKLADIYAIEKNVQEAYKLYLNIYQKADLFDNAQTRNEAAKKMVLLAPLWIEKAKEEEKSKDYAAALKNYRHAAAVDSQNSQAWEGIGKCLSMLGDEGALEALNKAIVFGTKSASAYIERSRILEKESRLEDAMQDIDEAIKICKKSNKPNLQAQSHLRLAELLEASGKEEEAIDELGKCIKIYVRLFEKGGFERAGDADAANANLAQAYYMRANLCLKSDMDVLAQKDLIEALKYFEKEGRQKESLSDIYYLLANLSVDIEDNKNALEYIQLSMNTGVQNAKAYALRGKIRMSMGDYSESWEDFTKAIELDPKDSKPYSLRAQVILEIMDENEGERKSGIEAKKAQAYGKLAKEGISSPYAQAMKDVQKALAINPKEEAYISQKVYLEKYNPIIIGAKLCKAYSGMQVAGVLEQWGIEIEEEERLKLQNFSKENGQAIFSDKKSRNYVAKWEGGSIGIYRALTIDEIAKHEWIGTYLQIWGETGEFDNLGGLMAGMAQKGADISRYSQALQDWAKSGDKEITIQNAQGDRLIARKCEGGFNLYMNNGEFDGMRATYSNWENICGAYGSAIKTRSKPAKLRFGSKKIKETMSDEDVAHFVALAYLNEKMAGVPAFIALGVSFYEGGMDYRVVKSGHTGAWAFTPSGVGGVDGKGEELLNNWLEKSGRRGIFAKLGNEYDAKTGRWKSNKIYGRGTRKAGYVQDLTNPAIEIFYFDAALAEKAYYAKTNLSQIFEPKNLKFAEKLTRTLFHYNGNKEIQEQYQHNCFDACLYFPNSKTSGLESYASLPKTNMQKGGTLPPLQKGRDYELDNDEAGRKYNSVLIKNNSRIKFWCQDEPTKGINGKELLQELNISGEEPAMIINGPYFDWANYMKKTMVPTDLIVIDGKVIWKSVGAQANGRDEKRKAIYGSNWTGIRQKAQRDEKTHMIWQVSDGAKASIIPVLEYEKRHTQDKEGTSEGVKYAIGGGPVLFSDGKRMIVKDATSYEKTYRSIIATTKNGETIFFSVRGANYEDCANLLEKSAKKMGVEIDGAFFLDGGASSFMHVRDEKGAAFAKSSRRMPLNIILQ